MENIKISGPGHYIDTNFFTLIDKKTPKYSSLSYEFFSRYFVISEKGIIMSAVVSQERLPANLLSPIYHYLVKRPQALFTSIIIL